jgi:hypothetical protein
VVRSGLGLTMLHKFGWRRESLSGSRGNICRSEEV